MENQLTNNSIDTPVSDVSSINSTPVAFSAQQESSSTLSPSPRKSSLILAVATAIVLLVGGIAFAFQYLQKRDGVAPAQTEPVILPGTLGEGDEFIQGEMSEWKAYSDDRYGFVIKYPDSYQIVENESEWANAILILYKGGQSYDLVIEVWNNKVDYETRYSNMFDVDPSIDGLIVKEKGENFITLLNNNETEEVDQILSTFEFVRSDEHMFGEKSLKEFLIKDQSIHIGVWDEIEISEHENGVFVASWPYVDSSGNRLPGGGSSALIRKINGFWVTANEESKCDLFNSYIKDEGLRAYWALDGC